MDDKKSRVDVLEHEIEMLPRGYISRKMINGKERLYLQWREGGRVKSRYIKEAEREQVVSEVEQRKKLEKELNALRHPKRMLYDLNPSEDSSRNSMAAGSKVPYGSRPAHYLKWDDVVIGEIADDYSVRFIRPDFNDVVKRYAGAGRTWSRSEFEDFLQERIVSPGRRDIEKILYRLGLTSYDPIAIGIKTHAICSRDLMWISDEPEAELGDVVTDVFRSVFNEGKDLEGDSVDTPEGQNVKRYGVSKGRYGIYKKRLSPVSGDVESELAVYALAERIGVPCCQCWRTDEDTVFSAFEYDFATEYIVHMRRIMETRPYDDDLKNMLAVRPGYLDFFVRMIALDFMTRQDDRHLSNIAVKMSGAGEEIYPLYDNGRSLFYEDTEETVIKAADDIEGFSTIFGPSGTYLDHVREISDMGISFRKVLDLDISEGEIKEILENAGFTGYRLGGAAKWIKKCVSILQELG